MSETIKISELMDDSGVAFGTSGARGTVESMDNRVCYAYTRAFIQALEQQGEINVGDEIVLSGDLRSSTSRILSAVAQAVKDAGYRVNYIGRLPSPALAYYAMQLSQASIMVTGSHIPDDRNGIKFNRPDGEILKQDEQRIKEQLVLIPDPFPEINTDFLDKINTAAALSYQARYLDFFPRGSLDGMHVGVYEHSGVGRDVLAEIISLLGAKVTPLARSEAFIPVDTEAIRPEDVMLGQQWSREYGFDAIVSTDGDADRPLIADEKGQWLRGDIVGVLCAGFIGADAVVTPVSSNTVVDSCGWFKHVYRTRIGSPYVIEKMNQLLAEDNTVVGYEANGGVLLGSDVRVEGRTIKALPTRDAVLPIISILVAARKKAKSISELLIELPPRFTASDRLKDFPTVKAMARIKSLADNKDEINRIFSHCCGQLKQMDATDGLRMLFENEEIIHLRPSGNAPELRCYNEAATAQRVTELNQICMKLLADWR